MLNDTPSLEKLPDNVIHQIFAHVEIQHLPYYHSISKRIQLVLSQNSFAYERINQGSAQELLVIVGGKIPAKLCSKYGKKSNRSRSLTMEYNSMGIQAYVPSLSSWMRFGGKNNFLDKFVDFHAVLVGCHTIVFLGGIDVSNGEVSKQVWSYSFTSNKWSRFPDMLRGRSSCTFEAAFVEDSIVVIGSDHCEDGSALYCEKYIFELNSWVNIANMPVELEDISISVIHNRFVYLYGFNQRDAYCSKIYIYDTANDKWSCVDDKSCILHGRCSSFAVYKNKIIKMGGIYDEESTFYLNECVEFGDHLNHVYSFDIITNLWRVELPRLNIKRRGSSSCIYNDCLTLVGGRSSTNAFHDEDMIITMLSNDDKQWILSEQLSLPAIFFGAQAFNVQI